MRPICGWTLVALPSAYSPAETYVKAWGTDLAGKPLGMRLAIQGQRRLCPQSLSVNAPSGDAPATTDQTRAPSGSQSCRPPSAPLHLPTRQRGPIRPAYGIAHARRHAASAAAWLYNGAALARHARSSGSTATLGGIATGCHGGRHGCTFRRRRDIGRHRRWRGGPRAAPIGRRFHQQHVPPDEHGSHRRADMGDVPPGRDPAREFQVVRRTPCRGECVEPAEG